MIVHDTVSPRFVQWLLANNLAYLACLFSEDEDMDEYKNKFSDCFEKDPDGVRSVTLVSASKDILFHLLFLKKADTLRVVFDYNAFVTQFVIVYEAFITAKELMDEILTRYNNAKELKDDAYFNTILLIIEI